MEGDERMSVPEPRKVTMSEVARHAGVSRTTVSFVLNDRPSAAIPAETRERIMAAVAELGYRPNAGARALASQRTKLIGLITEIVTAPFAAEIITGAQQRARANGQLILIASSEGDAGLEAAAVETMLEHRVDGLLFATSWHRPVSLPASVSEVPTALVHCFDPDGKLPSVVPDEVAGGYRATQRLIEAGHRRIGFINLDPDIPAAVGRRSGYEKALRDAGLEVDDTLVPSGHATADGGYEEAAKLLDSAQPPTALFCGNDRMAMGAYDAIKERGLRIPEDIAVVGFDNQELIAAYLRPRLTTVALPFQEMGSQGIDLLSRDLSDVDRGDLHVIVDCPLVERSSVGTEHPTHPRDPRPVPRTGKEKDSR